MDSPLHPRRRAPPGFLLFPFATLALAACGTRSILGEDGPQDVRTVDAGDARTDAQSPNDLLDITLPDVASIDVVVDVPNVDAPDAVDVRDVFDVPTLVDVRDVFDVPTLVDVRDVFDVPELVDARDVTDVPPQDVPQAPGVLRSAARFTILAGSTVTNSGLTTIVGEVGVSPGLAVTGIPSGTVIHAGDPVAATAQSDLTTAYNYLAGQPCGTLLTGQDLGGMVLPPGVYCFASSAMLTGIVVLDGQNQSSPRWIFKIASTLVTTNVAGVMLINNARACNVFWQTGSSATIGIATSFAGNIVSHDSITLSGGASLDGRALARTGGVTMDTNSVSNATCPDPPSP